MKQVKFPTAFQRDFGLQCVFTHTIPKMEEGDLSDMHHGEGSGMMYKHKACTSNIIYAWTYSV